MNWITNFSIWIIPSIILLILLTATWKKVATYEMFVEGAKEGVEMSFGIIPYLVGMLVSIKVFRESGAMDFIIETLSPVLSMFYIPAEILPLALIRPLSGNGALGMTSDLIATYGPDSFIGRLASTMQGSTDTTFYVLTVYFGAVGIKKMGDALKVGLAADVIGIIASIIIVRLVFL
ncbi:spore maturation protein [Salipaludibacillus neizhouensis]|uniref:Spore maturation protein n=1 Tax=Salipaludibacillus neizhouensis TaxID=885475 RepID=A0A3A9K4U7_9BACI|nr:spore maturation protein [Salipaludibacillus neizhouensis]RKL67637.1 spore maturation protein [Salipaludibacillus neizhouensis]